jgi:DNA-binding transcriptional LysR family regulator
VLDHPEPETLSGLAARLLRESGVHLDVNLEVNDSGTLLDLVEAGLGVALIAEALTAGRSRVHVARISGPKAVWTISAVTIAPEPHNPAARELWRLITRFRHRAAGGGQAPA